MHIAKEYLQIVESEEEMSYLLLEKDIDYRDSLNMIYDNEIVELNVDYIENVEILILFTNLRKFQLRGSIRGHYLKDKIIFVLNIIH